MNFIDNFSKDIFSLAILIELSNTFNYSSFLFAKYWRTLVSVLLELS